MSDGQGRPVALVTGAGSGIGRAVSQTLMAEGYDVVLSGRREQPLLECAADARGGDVLVCPGDVSSERDVERIFGTATTRFGRLDLLFNNAGVLPPAVPFGDTELEDVEANLRVNVIGSFLCARAAFRIMCEQRPMGGRIINNGSVSAQVPRPHATPYNIAKAAITGLTNSLSLEGRDYQIACGQIDIGNALTEMASDHARGEGALQPDGSRRVEPTFDVQHVGDAIRFMANLPLNANVQHITLMATGMPFVGRG